MNNKIKILALFGKSGSGKDTIQKFLVKERGMNGIISCTTRPKREHEKDGVDYHFLSEDSFINKILDYSMLEVTCFNNWFYGTSIESLDLNRANVGVFNINGIQCLLENNNLNVKPIYIQCNDKMRLKRVLNREWHPNCVEVCRRFLADEKDFKYIDFQYLTIENNDYDDHYKRLTINWTD